MLVRLWRVSGITNVAEACVDMLHAKACTDSHAVRPVLHILST